MDRVQETTNVVKDLSRYKSNVLEEQDLIKSVCSYFDSVKKEKLTQADLKFLKHLSNIAGIPHYYDILEKFNQELNILNFDLGTLSSCIYESTLHTSEERKVHKYQERILQLFTPEHQNRYFLSASTSFGKTHVVYEILKKMKYNNIVLVFPTIALLSENLEKIMSDPSYKTLRTEYSIHTLSEVLNLDAKNIFIYTPERYLSFIEKNQFKTRFDFFFVDEVYKIDNEYLIDDEVKENERDVAYRLALHYLINTESDALLAGPYIDFSKPDDHNYNDSFNNFLKEYSIKLIDYNKFEIVNKSFSEIKTRKEIKVDEELSFTFENSKKKDRLLHILSQINNLKENAIVYCSSRSSVESYAKLIISSEVFEDHNHNEYNDFIDHISNNFDRDWTLVKALKIGVGIHHSLVPKYIQKEIVNLFNTDKIKVLISTTTITEGVNTSAKNLVVLHSKKGNKDLKKFDAKNIAGRAGRFLHHYSGRVIILKNDFMKAINAPAEGIKHKNFDPNSPKDEIDLFYTKDEYLNSSDKEKLKEIKEKQSDRKMPDSLFELYKVVSRNDKIFIYDQIASLTDGELELIKRLISTINFRMDIDYDGFQLIIELLLPIIKNKKLKFLIEYKGQNDNYSSLTNLTHFYLIDGFLVLLDTKLGKVNQ